MPTLLLISPCEETAETIKSWLPDPLLWVCAESIEAAVSLLETVAYQAILLDASQEPVPAALYERLQATLPPGARRIPVIVLLSSLDERQAVLHAGAWEVLLLPLCRSEVIVRLSTCLKLQESQHDQEELRTYGAQMSYILLVARLIEQRLDLPTILAQILEQAAHLFRATEAEIWLLNDETRLLERAAALRAGRPVQPHDPLTCCSRERVAWIAEQKQVLLLPDSRDSQGGDEAIARPACNLLAASLCSQDRPAGVLLLCKQRPADFSVQDSLLMEHLAPLMAATVLNTKMLEKLCSYVDRQLILHEISHQVVQGLDLTLRNAIRWLQHISGAESGVLWLADEREALLEMAACLGIEASDSTRILPLEKDDTLQPAIFIQEPTVKLKHYEAYRRVAPGPFKNLLLLNMRIRGRLVGVVTLFNCLRGEPDPEDLQFMITTVEMIAGNVSNSWLHTRLLELMQKLEYTHARDLQDERLLTIGRLTASLAHEINNPLQAVRGAIDLAMEELHNPQALEEYLRLGLRESERVIRLVSRMRQLYRPSNDRPELLNLVGVLQEVLETGRQELARQNVSVCLLAPGEHLMMTANLNQMHLIFLSILLNLGDALGRSAGGQITINLQNLMSLARVDFSIPEVTPPEGMQAFQPNLVDHRNEDTQWLSSLSLTIDIIKANRGRIAFYKTAAENILRVELPIV